MARALLEAGHFPDMVYGTSAGALNAAALAARPSVEGTMALAGLWREVRRADVFPLRPWSLLGGLVGTSDHLVSPHPLRRWLHRVTLIERLEASAVPLTVVSTDIETGEEVLLNAGPAVPALMASAAMPGIFPPVRVGDRWLMDGSIVSDTPVGPAVAAGADEVWVLPCVPDIPTRRPRTPLEAVLRSSSLALARHHVATVHAWSVSCRLYVVPAPVVPGSSPFSFSHTVELLDAGYRKTKQWLPTARPMAEASHVGDH
jgi:NTE family protein